MSLDVMNNLPHKFLASPSLPRLWFVLSVIRNAINVDTSDREARGTWGTLRALEVGPGWMMETQIMDQVIKARSWGSIRLKRREQNMLPRNLMSFCAYEYEYIFTHIHIHSHVHLHLHKHEIG